MLRENKSGLDEIMKTIEKEGYIPFKGYKTWYRIVGECQEGKLPLLVLHGGPGMAHDYLEIAR